MSKIHGKGGSITWAGTGVDPISITDWNCDAVGDVAEITNMASAADWKEFLASFKTWTATVECFYTSTESPAGFLASDLSGAAAVLELEIVDAGAKVSGTAILIGVGFTTDANDAITATYAFQGDDSLTYS